RRGEGVIEQADVERARFPPLPASALRRSLIEGGQAADRPVQRHRRDGTARSARRRTASLMPGSLASAGETVLMEIPARSAMTAWIGRRDGVLITAPASNGPPTLGKFSAVCNGALRRESLSSSLAHGTAVGKPSPGSSLQCATSRSHAEAPMTITTTAFEQSPDGGQGLARDMRVRWALEEVGRPYAVRLLSFAAMKQPAHLALHPFGQIPTYEEDGLALFESGAIVLHIAG